MDDIDLFVAGTMEKAHGDSLLGPTFTCILFNEFERLKVRITSQVDNILGLRTSVAALFLYF